MFQWFILTLRLGSPLYIKLENQGGKKAEKKEKKIENNELDVAQPVVDSLSVN